MNIRNLRLFFIVLSLIFLLFFAYIKVSPLGVWTCQSNFKRTNHLFLGNTCFSRPSPSDRFILENNLKMIADPLYFSLYSPRNFDKLNLEIKFKSSLDERNPIIEAGLLVNRNLWHYQLKPVYNYWLEDYQSDWQNLSIEDDIEKILEDNCGEIPYNLCLAQYNINQSLPSYSLDKESKIIEQNLSLRGHHSFYLYLKDSDLNLKLKAEKINKNLKESSFTIDIYSNNNIILSEKFKEDEFENINIYLASMPEGFYRVDLKTDDNVIFNNLSLNSSILSFRNRLWLHSSLEEDINIVSDSRALQVKIQEPLAFQTLNFNGNKLDLNELYIQYEIINDSSAEKYYEISLERGGLLLEGPGVFAFDSDQLFNPNFSNLNRFYQGQAKFILVDYSQVERLNDDYYLAKLEFDLLGVYRENNKYNLIISIPGLRAQDDNNNYIEIKNIKARFSGKSLTEKINEIKLFNK